MSERLIPRDGEAETALVPPVEGWSNPYIGLPWLEKGDTREGVACWGLACLVYRELHGIDLPSYSDRFASSAELAEIATIVGSVSLAAPWRRVAPALEREFDIAVFSRAGIDCHVGIVVGRGQMLHICAGRDSHLLDYRSGHWAPRLSGFYRHAQLQALAA